MMQYCPFTGNRKVYLDCLECEDKEACSEQGLLSFRLQESWQRLRILGLHDLAEKFKFEKERICSETNGRSFSSYPISTNPSLEEIVRDYENKTNSTIFHIILEKSETGSKLFLIFTDNSVEKWKEERESAKKGIIRAYYLNPLNPQTFRTIEIEIENVRGEGLKRKSKSTDS